MVGLVSLTPYLEDKRTWVFHNLSLGHCIQCATNSLHAVSSEICEPTTSNDLRCVFVRHHVCSHGQFCSSEVLGGWVGKRNPFFFLVIWKLVGCMFKESIGSFEIVLPVVSLLFERQPLTELYTDQKA